MMARRDVAGDICTSYDAENEKKGSDETRSKQPPEGAPETDDRLTGCVARPPFSSVFAANLQRYQV
jgi:hypothetical protein